VEDIVRRHGHGLALGKIQPRTGTGTGTRTGSGPVAASTTKMHADTIATDQFDDGLSIGLQRHLDMLPTHTGMIAIDVVRSAAQHHRLPHLQRNLVPGIVTKHGADISTAGHFDIWPRSVWGEKAHANEQANEATRTTQRKQKHKQ